MSENIFTKTEKPEANPKLFTLVAQGKGGERRLYFIDAQNQGVQLYKESFTETRVMKAAYGITQHGWRFVRFSTEGDKISFVHPVPAKEANPVLLVARGAVMGTTALVGALKEGSASGAISEISKAIIALEESKGLKGDLESFRDAVVAANESHAEAMKAAKKDKDAPIIGVVASTIITPVFPDVETDTPPFVTEKPEGVPAGMFDPNS